MTMYADNADADDIRGWLLNEIDVRDATVEYTIHGMISTLDLWWLYEEHRIIAPADAWLLAAMWEDQLLENGIEKKMSDQDWWSWFDRGILDAADRNRS